MVLSTNPVTSPPSLLSADITRRALPVCFSLSQEDSIRLHVLVGNMKGIYRDGYYDGSIELRDVFNRRCVKCGGGDFAQGRTMRIRTSVVFWNIVFSLMFTCVRGTNRGKEATAAFPVFSVSVCGCVKARTNV